MRKIRIFIICFVVVVILGLLALLNSVYFNRETFNAVVIDNTGMNLTIYRISDLGDKLLVVGLESSKIVGENRKPVEASNIKPGQLIKITYDGSLLQVYPAIIENCYEIRLLGQADKELIDLAVSEYTQFNANIGQ